MTFEDGHPRTTISRLESPLKYVKIVSSRSKLALILGKPRAGRTITQAKEARKKNDKSREKKTINDKGERIVCLKGDSVRKLSGSRDRLGERKSGFS